jgi:hypothetical protein
MFEILEVGAIFIVDRIVNHQYFVVFKKLNTSNIRSSTYYDLKCNIYSKLNKSQKVLKEGSAKTVA